MTEVVVLLQAEINIQAAYEYFDELDPAVGLKFMQALRAGFERLTQFPEVGPAYKKPIRRLTISPFDYGIFYKIEGKRIAVLGVLSLRMSPQAILKRLSGRY